MRENLYLEYISDIREEFVSEAAEGVITGKRLKRNIKPITVIAAAIAILVLTTGTVMGVNYIAKAKQIRTEDPEKGWQVIYSAGITKEQIDRLDPIDKGDNGKNQLTVYEKLGDIESILETSLLELDNGNFRSLGYRALNLEDECMIFGAFVPTDECGGMISDYSSSGKISAISIVATLFSMEVTQNEYHRKEETYLQYTSPENGLVADIAYLTEVRTDVTAMLFDNGIRYDLQISFSERGMNEEDMITIMKQLIDQLQ